MMNLSHNGTISNQREALCEKVYETCVDTVGHTTRKHHDAFCPNRQETENCAIRKQHLNCKKATSNTVVTAKSLNSFKTRLDKFCYNQDIVYDFEAPLRITNNNRTGTRDLILIDNENEELITEEDRILRSEPS